MFSSFLAALGIPPILVMPFLALVAHRAAVMWPLVIFASVLRAGAATFSFTCTIMIINGSVPEWQLGAANGFGQSMASLARAVGPVLGSVIFAWSVSAGKHPYPFNSHLVFTIVAVLLVSCVVLVFGVAKNRVASVVRTHGSGLCSCRSGRRYVTFQNEASAEEV